MAYAVNRNVYGTIGTGRATGGVIGIFASLGIALAVLAFAAPFALRGVAEPTAATAIGGGVLNLAVGVLPFIAVPILAVLGGVWAGNATRDTGPAAIAGAIGGLVGAIVLVLLVGIGFALGVAASDAPVGDIAQQTAIPADLQNQLGFFVSAAGLTYLFAVLVAGAIAGAIVGAVRPEPYVADVDEDVERRPSRV